MRLDGLLPAVSRDFLAILRTSRRICFTKDAIYDFLEVLGPKKKKKNEKKNETKKKIPRDEPSRHRNGYGEGFKISHKWMEVNKTQEEEEGRVGESSSGFPSSSSRSYTRLARLEAFVLHSLTLSSLFLPGGSTCFALVCDREWGLSFSISCSKESSVFRVSWWLWSCRASVCVEDEGVDVWEIFLRSLWICWAYVICWWLRSFCMVSWEALPSSISL